MSEETISVIDNQDSYADFEGFHFKEYHNKHLWSEDRGVGKNQISIGKKTIGISLTAYEEILKPSQFCKILIDQEAGAIAFVASDCIKDFRLHFPKEGKGKTIRVNAIELIRECELVRGRFDSTFDRTHKAAIIRWKRFEGY